MNLAQLNKLVEKKKKDVLREFKRNGYVENLGQKQARDIDEASLRLAHDHTADWNERRVAGNVAINFQNWLDTL